MAGFRHASALGVGLLVASAPLAASGQTLEAAPFNPALAAGRHDAPFYEDRPVTEMKVKRPSGSDRYRPPDADESRR